MRPTTSVATYHITTMTNRSEIKSKVLTFYNFLMAHSNGKPIAGAFFNSKGKSLADPLFKCRIHYSEFIPGIIN